MVNSTLPDEEFVLTLMQIDEAKSVAEEVAGEANALNNLAGSVLKLSEKVEHDHSFLEREANQIDAQKIVKSFYVSGLVHTHSLYQAIIAPNTAGGLLSQAAVQRENYLAFGAEIEGIRTFLSEGKLLIKLPMLPVIWSRSYALTHIEKASALKRFFSFFTQSLHESLMLLDNEIPPFPSQSINYIFVFPCSENIVVDCDNFDTKAITDTICLHTFCDDSAEKTSFHMTGFRSDDVPRGTYICVCPDKFSSANPHEIIQIFHQNFADSPAKKRLKKHTKKSTFAKTVYLYTKKP